ncbi:MAG: starch-binding protein [Paludibacteraceae bacterium]|nr:starch-binding protein [Paludibacteraceae bacterium]
MKNFTNNFKQFTSRLSARWLIMALMMLVGTSSAWAASKRIYYLNTNDWSQVNCYVWNSNVNNGWPGAEMTKGNDGFYSCDIDESYTSIIFNCGSNYCQTSDLNIDFNKPYYAEGKWYSNLEEYYTEKGYIYFNAGDCIYMKNFKPSGWSAYWIDADDHYGYAEIGGTKYQFEYSSGTKNQDAYYKATITNAGWYKTVIFHRGSNTNTIWNSSGSIQLTSQGNCYFGWTVGGTNAEYETYTPPVNAGFWDLDAWNILYYSGVGYEGWIEGEAVGKVDANATIDLGEFHGTPYLKGFITNIWKKKDVSDVCEVKMTFTDGNGVTQTVSSLNENLEFEWRDIDDDPNDSEIKQEVKNYGLSYPLPNTEGNHTVTFTFTAVINNNGTGNCTETTTMTGTIRYEIPECSVPDGITIQYADGEKFCVNSNVTLSPSVVHEDGYTYAWVVSGTGWSINSGSAARECEVKVGTGVGSVTLTVSNATCSKEATSLNITPTASTPITKPTISAENQIICNGNNNSFLSVGDLTSGATYTLMFEGSEQADPAPISYTGSGYVKFAISKAGSYTVIAKTTDTEACQYTARATDEIDFTSISFSQSEYTTTPWVPVSIVVNVPEGTTYEYDDTAITGTAALKDAPIKTVSNNTYTYKLPRPTAWGEGNKTPANADVNFTVSAKITVDAETCNIQSTVKLQDEGNDNCTTNP